MAQAVTKVSEDRYGPHLHRHTRYRQAKRDVSGNNEVWWGVPLWSKGFHSIWGDNVELLEIESSLAIKELTWPSPSSLRAGDSSDNGHREIRKGDQKMDSRTGKCWQNKRMAKRRGGREASVVETRRGQSFTDFESRVGSSYKGCREIKDSKRWHLGGWAGQPVTRGRKADGTTKHVIFHPFYRAGHWATEKNTPR